MRRSALLAALALAGLVPASPAAAATLTHIAIVIAGHGVACVPWHSGITGDEVLNDVATVKYRPTDGIITQIDGQPGNNRADETHYWSYWHNTGSGWRYSTTGASAYHPKAGAVEGWHFISGSPTATPPPTRSYASICHQTVAAPVAPPRQPNSATATPRPAATRVGSTTTAVHSPAGATSAPRSSTPAATNPPRSSSSTVAGTSASSTAAASELPTLRARNTADANHRDSSSAVPTVLVLAVVLVLGGGATFVARRRRRTP